MLGQLEAGKQYYLKLTANSHDLILTVKPQYEEAPYSASVNIPYNTSVIETEAFANTGIESVSIPKSVKEIHSLAFADCKNLRKVIVNFPSTTFDSHCFENCSSELLLVAPLDSVAYRFAKEKGYQFRRLE